MENKNDYETPNLIASIMARMITPSDKRILEPCAGSGQIVRAILNSTMRFELVAHEISDSRVKKLAPLKADRRFFYFHGDFLLRDQTRYKHDLVMTRPPFDKVSEFVEKSLNLLNNEPESRLLFLLPISVFSSIERSDALKKIDAHIAGLKIIPGRIDCPEGGLQIGDAIFCIKKGAGDGNISFI